MASADVWTGEAHLGRRSCLTPTAVVWSITWGLYLIGGTTRLPYRRTKCMIRKCGRCLYCYRNYNEVQSDAHAVSCHVPTSKQRRSGIEPVWSKIVDAESHMQHHEGPVTMVLHTATTPMPIITPSIECKRDTCKPYQRLPRTVSTNQMGGTKMNAS